MSLKKSGSQVFLFLASLSKEEMEELGMFLQMPSVPAGDLLRRFWALCMDLHPDFPEAEVQKEVVHRRLFPDQSYKEKRIRTLFSDLSLQVRQYLSWKALQRDEVVQRVFLVGEFQRRGLGAHAEKEGAGLIQAGGSGTGAWGYLNQFVVSDLLFRGDDAEEARLYDAHLNLDRFFALAKMRLSALLFSRRGFLSGPNRAGRPAFLEAAEQYAGDTEGDDPLRIYRLVLSLLEGPYDQTVFFETKEAFLRNLPSFAPEDQRVIYQCLLNIAMRVVNERDTSLLRESWDLYKAGLETGLVFLVNGELSDVTFTNIVISGSKLGEYDWTESFIRDFAPQLAEEVRDNALSLGWAFWHYNRGDYGKAIELLRDVKFSSVGYGLRGRSLLLRTYFDQGMADNLAFSPHLSYHQEAFRRYIHRNRTLSDNRKQSYLNLLTYTQALTQLAHHRKAKKALASLKVEIESATQLIAKDWLLERLEEIAKKGR